MFPNLVFENCFRNEKTCLIDTFAFLKQDGSCILFLHLKVAQNYKFVINENYTISPCFFVSIPNF